MSSRREIVTTVEYPWIDPEFPDPIEDEALRPVVEELASNGIVLYGTTIDVNDYRRGRRGVQPQPTTPAPQA
jgi:hypothetical protein